MEFKNFSPKRPLLCGVLSLALVGCSSSTGYIDYADISGPQNPTESTTDDVTSGDGTTGGTAIDDDRSPSETDAAAPSSPAADMAVKSAGADPVEEVAVQSATPSEGSPPKVSDAASSNPDGGTTVTTADAETPSPENTDPPLTKNSDSAPAIGPSTPATVSTTGPEAGANGETESSEPRQIKLLVPEKRFRTEKDSDAVRISYDDIDLLKILNMEPVPVDAAEHFPQWLRDLNGKRIRLRGFMFPTFVATGITNFGLARDNGICCFVKQPKIYDMIEVSMAEGQSTDYIENKPFDVEGIFRIEPDGDDTELFQLYRIEEAIVLK